MATGVKSTAHSTSNGSTRHSKNNKIEILNDKFQFLSEETDEKLHELIASVNRVSRRYIKVGRQYIKENPGTGLIVATAVGFVAGTLVSFVMRQRK